MKKGADLHEGGAARVLYPSKARAFSYGRKDEEKKAERGKVPESKGEGVWRVPRSRIF